MEQLSLKDWLIRFFFVFLFMFMFNRLFFFSPGVAESTTSYVLYPVLKMQKFFVDPLYSYFLRRSQINLLVEEIKELKASCQDLQGKLIAAQSTFDFEERSLEVRQYAEKYDFSSQKIVQILMRSFDEEGHFFWIDAGSQMGVSLNMIALYKNNIVGRVIHVDHWYSKIALITDKRCKVAVSCAETKTVGIFEGHNDFEPTLEFVPHYEKLLIDDMILSTGQGLVYPQGFALGKIKHFEVQDVAYKVIIEPYIDLHTIEYIYLIAI